MVDKKILNDFKDLKITKKELEEKIGTTQLKNGIHNPIEITAQDVVNLLKAYQSSRITIDMLLQWVNTVWFTDLFTYSDNYCDSIASVMNKLEEIDENGYILANNEIEKYVQALITNTEIT
ncbi:MAG: hypothetical protein VB118_11940 [Oscillospiraceae bacterium]|nr:hypothetical protein [Oscillospiraceae bacterium]